jgi:Flp pilus assembly protein TadD
MYIASYQQEEDEKARVRQRLSKEAVNLALQGRWEEAEATNRDIIEKFPSDVEAYNRLGRALTELGNF